MTGLGSESLCNRLRRGNRLTAGHRLREATACGGATA